MKIETSNPGTQLSEQLSISKNKLGGNSDFLDLIMCLFETKIEEMPAVGEETKELMELQNVDGQSAEDCIGFHQCLYQPYVNSGMPINLQPQAEEVELTILPVSVSLQQEANTQLNQAAIIESTVNQSLNQSKEIKELMQEVMQGTVQNANSEEGPSFSNDVIAVENKSNSSLDFNGKNPVLAVGFNQEQKFSKMSAQPGGEAQTSEIVQPINQEKTKSFNDSNNDSNNQFLRHQNQTANQPVKIHTENNFGPYDQSKSFSQNPYSQTLELNSALTNEGISNNSSTINQTFAVAGGGNQNNSAPPASTVSHQEPIPMQLAPVIQRAVLQSSSHQATLKLKLKPDHLGELTIQLVYSKGSLNAQFITADHLAKEAVEGSFPMLKEILAQNNIKLDDAFAFVGNPSGDKPNEHGQSSYSNGPYYKQTKVNTAQTNTVSDEQPYSSTENSGLDRLI